ncbi:MAG TPA: hypothetical protein VGG72_07780 [Bryobacteraceae bacterium]
MKQKTADWDALARGLDASIQHLLPCDPKAAAAITEVSKASEERIAALSAFLHEASRQASLETAAARRALALVEPLGADLATEKLDVAQEQSGVSAQIATLTDSGQQHPSLKGPEDTLRQIAALEQERSGAVDSGISHSDAASAGVRGLIAQLEAREAALQGAQAAFDAEGGRWSAYYAARLARAQTECAVTRGVILPPTQPQGKPK